MAPFPQVLVGVHRVDYVLRSFVDCVLEILVLAAPFDNDDVEVMVEGGEAVEEAVVVVVVAVEEAVAVVGAHGTLVLLVVARRFARRSLGS